MPWRELQSINRPTRRLPLLGGCLGLLAVICFALGLSIVRKVDEHGIAPTDSNVFSVAQIEVEYLKFDRALRDAMSGQGELSEMRRWFDIFYSRLTPPETSRTFVHYLDTPDFMHALEEVRTFALSAAQIIDAPSDELQAALPRLLAMSQAIEPAVRRSALSGLSSAYEKNEALWSSVLESLKFSARLLAIGIGGLVVLGATLLALVRVSESRAREIESQSSRMRMIVETSLDAIFVLDSRGRVQMINEVAQAQFGLTPETVEGRDMLSVFSVDDAARERLSFLTEGRRPVADERWLEAEARINGRRIPIEISVDSTDTRRGWSHVAFVRDISQRRAAERALRKARDRALAGERAKAEFLDVMSHEMRTPLNGVLGAVELLRDTPLTARQSELVETVDRSGEVMLSLVDGVLDLAKFSSGRGEPEPQVVDPHTLVDSVTATLRAMAASAGLRLSWTRGADLPDRIVADPKLLRHVLMNLVSNAIKFTPSGRVDIAMDLEESDMLVIRVSDTGIGIAPEDRERIFGDFETADPSYTRRHRGTGLGLGIAKRIVDLLGGTIGVDSEQSVGSTFWLRVPVGVPADQPRPVNMDAAPGRPLRILLVEDNEINRLVAGDFLRREGHEVIEACDGVEGVARAESEVFDAILMDISMPRMDGPTAARRIRSGGGRSAKAPIIGVTAQVLPGVIDSLRKAGMDDCVTKPLDPVLLAQSLRRAAGGDVVTGELCRADTIDSMQAILGPERTVQLAIALSDQMERDLPRLCDSDRPMDQRGQLAHDLAGAAAGFGLTRLHGALCEVERAIKVDGVARADALSALGGLWVQSRISLDQRVCSFGGAGAARVSSAVAG